MYPVGTLAHTDSLGFLLSTEGSNEGLYTAEIFYGSWHGNMTVPEGALDLRLADGTLIGTETFQIVDGFGNVPNGTVPDGLVAGENYFFPDKTTPEQGDLTGDPAGHPIYAFQSVTFYNLEPGQYLFGYNIGSSFSINWEPSDQAINNGSFSINADGTLGSVGGATQPIRNVSTLDDLHNGNVEATFDGGTLTLDADSDVGNNFEVTGNNGTIDTGNASSTFSGDFSGDGQITVTGGGTLTASGTNTHGGFNIDGATLSVGDDGNLGDGDAGLDIANGGLLNTSASFTTGRTISIGADGGGFNTDEDTVLGLTGDVTGAGGGCLVKSGLGTLNLLGTASNDVGACVQQGLLAVNGTFTGNVWVNPQGILGGSGTINGDVQINGTFSPGNSPGITIINGSVTQLPGSTLEIEIDGPTAGNGAGFHDQIQLVGAGSVYTADGTLTPILRGISAPANNDFTPAIGDTFDIILAEGGIAGSFATIVQPANGLPANSRFDAIYGSNTITLAVTANSYAQLAASYGLINGRNVGAAVDVVRPSAGIDPQTALGAFLAGLAGLTPDGAALALQQASGDIHADLADTMVRANQLARDTIRNRILASSRYAAHDAAVGMNRHIWGDIAGQITNVSGDAYAHGYDGTAVAGVVGADGTLANGMLLGAAVSLTTAKADTALMGSGRGNSYGAHIYGQWDNGASFAGFIGGIAFDDYRVSRSVSLSTGSQPLSADPKGASGYLDVEAGHRVNLGDFTIEGIAGLGWNYQHREAFAETGNGSVALVVDALSRHIVETRAGARLSSELAGENQAIFPYVEAFVVQRVAGDRGHLDASLNGAKFTAHASDPGGTSVKLALGAEASHGDNARLSIQYVARLSERATSHGGKLGLSVTW